MFANKPKFGQEKYASGTTIIHQGDVPDKFYIITSGQVEVVDQPLEGVDVAITCLGPGQFFGEIGMVKHSRRTATVRAATDVEVLSMDYRTFHRWLSSSMFIREEINAAIEQRIPPGETLQLVESQQRDIELPDRAQPEKPSIPAQSEFGPQHFEPGVAIIRQGDAADNFYIIVEGEVEVTRTGTDGEEVLLARLAEGSYFGEIGLLDGRERIATVRAVSGTKVVVFNRQIFSSWMAKSPGSRDEIEATAERRRLDTGM